MNKIRKMLSIILVLSITLISTCPVLAAETQKSEINLSSAKEAIYQMFDAVNHKDWTTFSDLMCSQEADYYRSYFADNSIEDGIKQVDAVLSVKAYAIENEIAEEEWLKNEYPILETSSTIYSFVAEVNCEVSKENQFFYNGINYFLIILAVEDGNIKVVQFNRPSVSLIKDQVQPLLISNGKITEDEKDAINVLESAEKGLVVNGENEILTEGFELATRKENGEIMPMAVDPPMLSHYSTYSYPTSIKVKLDQTGNNAIVTVSMTSYMKNVLPNEWIPSWNTEALKAGAYCVKMVGIYRAISPMSSAGGYNLTQSTQMYKPNSSYASTSKAIDSINNSGMADSSGKLFFPWYAAGTSGSRGTKGSGILQQRGTQKLASTDGYSCRHILNYYYSGSDYSSGDVSLFGYSIGY